MSKFIYFTNAEPTFDGDSIAINVDAITSVFELNSPNKDIRSRTVLQGVNGIDWQVKENYLDVVARLNAD
jgi:hypothetical protein